ncbi:MAG: mechanosensitive ion channel [Calditrichia bacterium]|nr:mechanosensitive ion channel [Calditrichia bacterium]
MRPIYLVIFLLCFFSINGILLAEESTDSLQIQSSDSSAFDLEHTDLSSQYDYLSDSFRILYAILLFIIAFILSIYLRQPLQRLSEHRTRYSHILKQIVPLFLIIFWFFVIYIIMTQMLNLTYISSISLLVIFGFALALAFQDILRDIIAGLIVPFEEHIEKGNKIQIGDIYGEITKTGFRETLIKKPDGNIVVVPNSRIIKETVVSVSAERENCPVRVDFYLPLLSDLDKCREIAHKSAIVSPYLFLDKPVTVRFSNELSNGQPIIKMRVEAFLRKIEFQLLFTSELTESVVKEIGHATDIPDFR